MTDSRNPEWLNQEFQRTKQESQINLIPNPVTRPRRSVKGMRIREDFQIRFETLVAHEKIRSGRKGPDLIEEALQLLFTKYGC